jgi:hypothetical protein
MGRRWLTGFGVLIVVFEVLAVLVLRAHYTMDVFTGLVTGLYAAHMSSRISGQDEASELPGIRP